MNQFLRGNYYLPAHILAFFAAQSTYAYFYATSSLRTDLLAQAIIRPLIWLGPVLVVLLVLGENALTYLKLWDNLGKGLLWGAGAGSLVILYNIGTFYLQYQHVGFKFNTVLAGLTAFFSVFNIIGMAPKKSSSGDSFYKSWRKSSVLVMLISSRQPCLRSCIISVGRF
jgi:hypothetical protein